MGVEDRIVVAIGYGRKNTLHLQNLLVAHFKIFKLKRCTVTREAKNLQSLRARINCTKTSSISHTSFWKGINVKTRDTYVVSAMYHDQIHRIPVNQARPTAAVKLKAIECNLVCIEDVSNLTAILWVGDIHLGFFPASWNISFRVKWIAIERV